MTTASLHRFARLPRQFLVALGVGMSILTVGALLPPSSSQHSPPAASQRLQAHYSRVETRLDASTILWQESATTLPDVLPVVFYTPTETCESYRGDARAIAADKAITQVVYFLVAEQTPRLINFELAGYRIRPNPKGNSVTIDFRRRPDAQRHFVSLSICEQRVLFGSLRKTLLDNPSLNIDTVQFTERGRPIVL